MTLALMKQNPIILSTPTQLNSMCASEPKAGLMLPQALLIFQAPGYEARLMHGSRVVLKDSKKKKTFMN